MKALFAMMLFFSVVSAQATTLKAMKPRAILKEFDDKESQKLVEKTQFEMEVDRPQNDPKKRIWDTVYLELFDP